MERKSIASSARVFWNASWTKLSSILLAPCWRIPLKTRSNSTENSSGAVFKKFSCQPTFVTSFVDRTRTSIHWGSSLFLCVRPVGQGKMRCQIFFPQGISEIIQWWLWKRFLMRRATQQLFQKPIFPQTNLSASSDFKWIHFLVLRQTEHEIRNLREGHKVKRTVLHCPCRRPAVAKMSSRVGNAFVRNNFRTYDWKPDDFPWLSE